jgi:hypothetical protein
MSFDMDFTGVLSFAADLFNSLWPIFRIPLGLILAFGIIGWVYSLLEKKLANPGHG